MRRIFYLSAIAITSLIFLGCEKEDQTKGPKIDTLSAEKGSFLTASLTGRVSRLEGVASDFECGIEYSTDASFSADNTTRLKSGKNYSEVPYTVSIKDLTSGQKYYYRAYYINQLLIYYGAVKDFTFTWEIPQNGTENGYEYIELGLSVKWATCNVGAAKPEEYGDYYAWGETETKTTYDWSTYKWCNGSSFSFTKYGSEDYKTVLDPEDDVAHVKWGGSWRMPTKAEQDELLNSCTWTWYSSGNTEFNGVAGYKVTSNKFGYNDRSIFLPATGCRLYATFFDAGSCGYYWSSSLDTSDPGCALDLSFSSDSRHTYGTSRVFGKSVRPVRP